MRHFSNICLRFPIVKSEVFCLFSSRWTPVFVPLSDSFPLGWTTGKQAVFQVFTAWLTLWKQIVFRCFTGVFQSQNSVLTGVYSEFSRIVLVFTARLTLWKQIVSSCFTGVFQSQNSVLTGVYSEFSLIVLVFTGRLTHAKQVVFHCLLVFSSFKTTRSVEFWGRKCSGSNQFGSVGEQNLMFLDQPVFIPVQRIKSLRTCDQQICKRETALAFIS